MPFAPALRLSACAAALLFVACAPDQDPLDTLTTVTAASHGSNGSGNSGNSGGSGNTGGTDGTGGASNSGTDGTGGVTSGASEPTGGGPTGGTTGGGVAPAQVCLDFLACIGAASPADLPQFEMAFGPDSQCWINVDIAQSCADQCASSLGDFATQYPDVPECGGGGGGTTNDTGPVGEWGNCGWDDLGEYYGCLDVAGAPDPNGTYPIDCPLNLPQVGDACNRNSEVNGIGCCTANGDNYYCDNNGMIAVDNCGG